MAAVLRCGLSRTKCQLSFYGLLSFSLALLLLLADRLTSQQHASVPQGRICSDIRAFCHTEIEVADQMFSFTQSQCTDTGPTSLSADLTTPNARQDSHWSTNSEAICMARPGKRSTGHQRGVKLSRFAFSVCHQCCSAESSLRRSTKTECGYLYG